MSTRSRLAVVVLDFQFDFGVQQLDLDPNDLPTHRKGLHAYVVDAGVVGQVFVKTRAVDAKGRLPRRS